MATVTDEQLLAMLLEIECIEMASGYTGCPACFTDGQPTGHTGECVLWAKVRELLGDRDRPPCVCGRTDYHERVYCAVMARPELVDDLLSEPPPVGLFSFEIKGDPVERAAAYSIAGMPSVVSALPGLGSVRVGQFTRNTPDGSWMVAVDGLSVSI